MYIFLNKAMFYIIFTIIFIIIKSKTNHFLKIFTGKYDNVTDIKRHKKR